MGVRTSREDLAHAASVVRLEHAIGIARGLREATGIELRVETCPRMRRFGVEVSRTERSEETSTEIRRASLFHSDVGDASLQCGDDSLNFLYVPLLQHWMTIMSNRPPSATLFLEASQVDVVNVRRCLRIPRTPHAEDATTTTTTTEDGGDDGDGGKRIHTTIWVPAGTLALHPHRRALIFVREHQEASAFCTSITSGEAVIRDDSGALEVVDRA